MPQLNYIGQGIDQLDTPVLLVDLEVLERNIERMARVIIHEAGVRWRPHTKGMKTPALAHMAIRAGASGVTCAKLGEAEVMAAAGVRKILIANQVVGKQKVTRLANLRRHANVIVAVDSVENVDELDRAGITKGVKLGVVIEVDVGMKRAGLLPGEPTLTLARETDDLGVDCPEDPGSGGEETGGGNGARGAGGDGAAVPGCRDRGEHHQLWGDRHLLAQRLCAGDHRDSGGRRNPG